MSRIVQTVLLPVLLVALLSACESRTKAQHELEQTRLETEKQREALRHIEAEYAVLEQEANDASAKVLTEDQRVKMEDKIRDLESDLANAQAENTAAAEASKSALDKLTAFKAKYLPR